ncbi:MAG: hypothetical protein ACI4XM_08585 [Candidatus Coprovivens sp.]
MDNIDIINYLSNLVDYILNNDFDKNVIESILCNIIAKDSNGDTLVNYIVREKGNNTAIFIPRYEVIEVSMEKLRKWIDSNGSDLMEMFKVDNKPLLDSYLLLMVLLHEVEHSNQYLVSKGLLESSCVCIKEAYKSLFDLLIPKDYVLPRPIKVVRRTISIIAYKSRENEFLLERNAQFESLGLLAQVAFRRDDNKIGDLFIKMQRIFSIAGYKDNCDGALINTFKDIYMGDKLTRFNHDYDSLSIEERYRLGLPVDHETRKKILSLK